MNSRIEAPEDDLQRQIVESRAFQAVLWGMPAVNADLMRQEMLTKTLGKVNQFIYWGRPLDFRNQTLTPNPDAIYFMAFFDMRDVGPLVLEIPKGNATAYLNGNIVTQWQAALEDVGLLGVDKGAGGKFLLLPPGYDGKLPPDYSPLQSDTYAGFALLRSNLESHGQADVDAAIAYGKQAKLYPLSSARKPPPNTFEDVKDVTYDSTIRYDLSFFQSLDRVVQSEPWIERDRLMIDTLGSIGIHKGKTFAPDAAMRDSLTTAITTAKRYLDARYAEAPPPFFEGTHWTLPALPAAIKGQSTNHADHDQYAVDARALAYTYAYIALKRLGVGQYYLFSIRDKDAAFYDGASTYRLNVPANVPIDQYWSVTAYDRRTHALIREMPYPSRSSQIADLQRNEDGSIDIYFGPQAPPVKEPNWLPTDPKGQFELIFRLYGPRKEFFDKVWRLPDAEKIAAH